MYDWWAALHDTAGAPSQSEDPVAAPYVVVQQDPTFGAGAASATLEDEHPLAANATARMPTSVAKTGHFFENAKGRESFQEVPEAEDYRGCLYVIE
ncbi:MAG: hypothetical protein QOE85_603 [Actinomycetota bacterium]|nr:hypothetical protein [Glaciihabitans sp.]MDQ1561262.1 hypothetical protein [Actinomycetota bacterium]